MAHPEKFIQSAVYNQIRHIERRIENSSNKDIDTSRTHLNYYLSPERDISSFSYYKKRKEELYVYNRKDVVHMIGWVITKPKDLPDNLEEEFFSLCYQFCSNRYGANNVVSAIVHKDEATPHMHFCFMPAVKDLKHGGEKLCANDVLNPTEMENFHPALQKFLNEAGMPAKVLTGVTKRQGGNKTVRQMKQERKLEHEHVQSRWHSQTQTFEKGRWER